VDDPQVLILDNGKANALYLSWASSLSLNWIIVDDYDGRWNPPSNAALIVTAQHYREPEYSILMRMTQLGVPTLIIADGILEYRNTWQNPEVAAGCVFQPVIGHKIACLGRSQIRLLESWGSLGKCELVGSPWLDPLIGKSKRHRIASDSFRFLVMTAKKLGFTPDQVALTKRSIRDLKLWFSHHPKINGTKIDVIWRLSEELDKEIGVPNQLRYFGTEDLAKVLDTVDAVVATSSTSMLEAMLYGIPVALLDYHNTPHYVPAAWAITAPRHADQVLPELMNPPAAKMLYQETVLHDTLETRTPAAPRMVRLVEAMVRTARQCHKQQTPLVFPPRILSDPQHGYHMPEEIFDMAKLYPNHPVFGEQDRTKLQVHINQLQTEINKLRNKIRIYDLLREAFVWFPGPRKMSRLWRSFRKHGTKNFAN
jgi:hypothetical protein